MATRREFLRLAALAGAGAALGGSACSPGGDTETATASTAASTRTLRIAQWGHFVPTYDQWFDNEYTKAWGERNGVDVVVDHIDAAGLQARAAAEVAAGRGHDIFGFIYPPAAFEDAVIDHRELVEEAEDVLGKMTPLLERSVYNPRTKRYFGFPEFWAPNAINYRTDLWDAVGARPDSWDQVRSAGPRLRAMGHPLGLGMFSQDLDSNLSCFSLMHAYGASVQDEASNVTINGAGTVEAVKVAAAMFQGGMTEEILSWEAASNNRFLASGEGSLILNPVSAVRAIEKQDPELAKLVALAPVPTGPVQRVGSSSFTGIYVIWNFARNQDAAKRFLVDLARDYREALLHSEFYNLPAFPGAVTDLAERVATDPTVQPQDKYALLAGAADWSTNVGHPGYAHGAVDEVYNQHVIPQMFGAAARGEMTAEEAVAAAEARMKPIFDTWRERGKI